MDEKTLQEQLHLISEEVAEQALNWVKEGRRSVEIKVNISTNYTEPVVTSSVWAYDYEETYGTHPEDLANLPTAREMKLSNLKGLQAACDRLTKLEEELKDA